MILLLGCLGYIALLHRKQQLAVRSASLSDGEDARMKRAWLGADADGDGGLDQDELRAVFESVGHTEPLADFGRVFTEIDLDKDGVVNYEEFKIWFAQQDSSFQETWYTRAEELVSLLVPLQQVGFFCIFLGALLAHDIDDCQNN
eukprot:SAG31_NODE_218_length_19934_cov_81.634837_11_plen_145_part_00